MLFNSGIFALFLAVFLPLYFFGRRHVTALLEAVGVHAQAPSLAIITNQLCG